MNKQEATASVSREACLPFPVWMVLLITAKLRILIASWATGPMGAIDAEAHCWVNTCKLYKNYSLGFYKALDILPGCAYYAQFYNSHRDFPMEWDLCAAAAQLHILSSTSQSPFTLTVSKTACNAVLSHWLIVSLCIKVTFLNITLPTHFPCTDAVAKKPDYTTVLFAQVESCAFWSVFPWVVRVDPAL